MKIHESLLAGELSSSKKQEGRKRKEAHVQKNLFSSFFFLFAAPLSLSPCFPMHNKKKKNNRIVLSLIHLNGNQKTGKSGSYFRVLSHRHSFDFSIISCSSNQFQVAAVFIIWSVCFRELVLTVQQESSL